jgi:hypothetical protein
MTPKEVAEYMIIQMENGQWLFQETIVHKIKAECGRRFVYENANGNYGIDKRVLKEFKKLTQHTLIWELGFKAWRRRKASDQPGWSNE